MNGATRTTEGLPGNCPVCGKRVSVAPGEPLSDVVCPHCGVLFYLEFSAAVLVPDDLKRLSSLGVDVETDDEGEVTRIQLNGPKYNDQTILDIAKMKGIPIIDIRNTAITHDGALQLRALLPDAVIEH